MNQEKIKAKDKKISKERAFAIMNALRDFYPKFYNSLVKWSSKKFKLENYS